MLKKDDHVRSTPLAVTNGVVKETCFGRVAADQSKADRISVVVDGRRSAAGFHIDFWERAVPAAATTTSDDLDYDSLVRTVQTMPKTWIGGLLAEIVERAVKEPFFRDDQALCEFVARAVARARSAR
jgi:hypothetical protein